MWAEHLKAERPQREVAENCARKIRDVLDAFAKQKRVFEFDVADIVDLIEQALTQAAKEAKFKCGHPVSLGTDGNDECIYCVTLRHVWQMEEEHHPKELIQAAKDERAQIIKAMRADDGITSEFNHGVKSAIPEGWRNGVGWWADKIERGDL